MTTMAALRAERTRTTARKKRVAQALKILQEGISDLEIKTSYRTKLRKDVSEAPVPTRRARAIVRDLRDVHGVAAEAREETPFNPSAVDLSPSAEARRRLSQRLPAHLRDGGVFDAELAQVERAVLRGEISQMEFAARLDTIVAKPLPAWMSRTTATAR